MYIFQPYEAVFTREWNEYLISGYKTSHPGEWENGLSTSNRDGHEEEHFFAVH
jgi:hypothetical protein